MRKALFAVAAAAGLLFVIGTAGCTDKWVDDGGVDGPATGTSGNARIGVVFPDTTSSVRWSTQDSKYLKAAFDKSAAPVEIDNALGDRAQFVRIADRMIAGGATVLIIVSPDADTGREVLAHARKAKVKTIDYDRLTLNGGADYYVSFDNVKVGRLQGQGLVKCLSEKKAADPVVAEINGSPSDNNATLFKQGYDAVLQPKYDRAEYTKGPDQWAPDWDAVEGGQIFTQMIKQQPRIRGVLAANDGLAGAVIQVLKLHRLNGKVPVTGQDATVESLRAILTGDQCMTVYKAIRPQAEAAANLAVALYRGEQPATANLGHGIDRIKDPVSGGYVPFVSLTPQSITRDTIQKTVDDGFADPKAICRGKLYQQLCQTYGIHPRKPS